jgi:hypothetical protein
MHRAPLKGMQMLMMNPQALQTTPKTAAIQVSWTSDARRDLPARGLRQLDLGGVNTTRSAGP